MTDHSAEVAAAVAEVGGVNLPEGFELLEVAGRGSCSVVFKARQRGEIVALKVYRPEVVEKYRKKYDLNIAVYEMSQNRKFRKVPDLLPFSAKPIMVLGHGGQQSVCFVQEFIEGIPLKELCKRERCVPASVLEAGEVIARAGDQAGLKELDLAFDDVLVRQQSGRWLPVIHDFNKVPTDHHGNKALIGLFKKGPRSGNELVREWSKLGAG